MPQSLSAVYVHLVFSTKRRRPFLHNEAVREHLFKYIAGISRRADCPALEVGGHWDHVHVLARLSRTVTQAAWIKEVKRVSSIWMQQQIPDGEKFSWQGGYGIFSVSMSALNTVQRYIANQQERHRRLSFQDEMRELMRRHEMQLDERYFWE